MRDAHPPSQLSIHDDLPGYREDALLLGQDLLILLDGEPAKGVIAYDCEAGKLWRFKQDEEGRFLVENDDAVREEVSGRVEVRWR